MTALANQGMSSITYLHESFCEYFTDLCSVMEPNSEISKKEKNKKKNKAGKQGDNLAIM